MPERTRTERVLHMVGSDYQRLNEFLDDLSTGSPNTLLTTRGDLIRRGASTAERVALGASGTLLRSDGTDAAWAAPATAAEYRVGATTKPIGVDQAWAALAEVTLTDAASIAIDFSLGLDFVVTLGGNRTLANGTNLKVGQRGRIRAVQDATGTRTLAYGTDYEFAGGAAITLSTAVAAQDIIYYDIIAAGRVLLNIIKAIA